MVGITSQIKSDSGGNEGVGFAIPSNTVRSVVSQLISSGKVVHAFLGVSIVTPPSDSGARVSRIMGGSPAAGAGLRAGDVIKKVDGKNVSSADALQSLVGAKKPGDEISITYVRNGSEHTAHVSLGTRPS